jgi:hypothetical protein
MLDEDVSDQGTGISFTPATRFVHRSGDAVQALGSGIRLEKILEKSCDNGTAVHSPQVATAGYQGTVRPDQWYGAPLSPVGGSIALMDASGNVTVDAVVYGSQQSNSSANGIITNSEIATLEGDQSQGGCIAVVPGSFSGRGQFIPAAGKTDRSVGRFPDGADNDSNCNDFLLQRTISLAASSAAGAANISVTGVADFSKGQRIIIGRGADSESVVVESTGTAGVVTLSTPLALPHEAGTQVADYLPTPGAPNQYFRKPR